MEDLKKSVKELEVKLDDNVKLIIQNMNRLHSHEDKINANASKIEQNSLALALLKDSKNQTRKLFVMWIITFIALIGVTCYVVYLLNDISNIETIQEISDVNTIGGNVVNGDMYGED